jgi:hypothetical protein
MRRREHPLTPEEIKERAIGYRAKYKAKHPDARRKAQLAYRKAHAEEHREYRRNYYAANTAATKALNRKSYAKLRAEWLVAYGSKCECCGETETAFLTIEHRNGGGNKHKKEIKTNVIYWLRKMGWPQEEFGILCFNCNMASSNKRICPHKLAHQLAASATNSS